MKKILLLIALLAFIGCSHKKARSNLVEVSPNITLEYCKSNIKTREDGAKVYTMSQSDFNKCKVLFKKEEYNKSVRQAKRITNLDLSKFGVKSVYMINERRDIKILGDILEYVYKYQLYTSDYVKYNRGDFHENIAPYIDFLNEVEQNQSYSNILQLIDERGFERKHFAYVINRNNTTYIWMDNKQFKVDPDDRSWKQINKRVVGLGKWYVTGDCESTYLAIETFAIRKGINPQRIFENYVEITTDASLVSPIGGHMLGYYHAPSGTLYGLEQLPYLRTVKMLINEKFYKFIEFRRADMPIDAFKKFPPKMLEDMKAGVKIPLKTTNERTK